LAVSAEALLDRFDAAKAAWIARSSPKAWEVARQQARVLVQFLANVDDWSVRDAAMAENLQWIATHEHAKVVAWAHNGHIQHIDDGSMPMGEHLRRALGRAYVAVGLLFDHGSFIARDPAQRDWRNAHTVAGQPAGTTGATLAAAGVRFVVDVRRPPAGIVRDWLRSAHLTRDIGSWFSPTSTFGKGLPIAIGRSFDLVAFVDGTTPARALHPGDYWDARALQPTLANGGFETVDGGKPSVWPEPRRDYLFTASADKPFAGRHCGHLRRVDKPAYDSDYAVVEQHVDAALFRGKRLRFSGAVRLDAPGEARLYLIVQAGNIAVARETMRDRPITARGWHEYSIEVDVSSKATDLYVGGALMSGGGVCFDELRLEVPAPR
jgi:hypothetical protein